MWFTQFRELFIVEPSDLFDPIKWNWFAILEIFLKVLYNHQFVFLYILCELVCKKPGFYSLHLFVYIILFFLDICNQKNGDVFVCKHFFVNNLLLCNESFVSHTNSFGPKVDPWGTPRIIFSDWDVALFTFIHRVLLVRYLLVGWTESFAKFNLYNLCGRILWSQVSMLLKGL